MNGWRGWVILAKVYLFSTLLSKQSYIWEKNGWAARRKNWLICWIFLKEEEMPEDQLKNHSRPDIGPSHGWRRPVLLSCVGLLRMMAGLLFLPAVIMLKTRTAASKQWNKQTNKNKEFSNSAHSSPTPATKLADKNNQQQHRHMLNGAGI